MSSVMRATHLYRVSVALPLLVAIAGCSSLQWRSETSAAPTQNLSETERIAHVLSRLTFGARSGDAARVAAMGVDRWIDQQLHPQSIATAPSSFRWRRFPLGVSRRRKSRRSTRHGLRWRLRHFRCQTNGPREPPC